MEEEKEEREKGTSQCLGITKKKKERCKRLVRSLKRCWQHVEGEEKEERDAKKRKKEERDA